MSYVIINNDSVSGRYYFTDTCNKPRMAMNIGGG